MTLNELVTIERKKISIKKYWKQVFLANIAIALLTFMTPFMNSASGGEIPPIAITTIIDTLVKSVFLVWEAVLIANLIIEEFRSKTILLLFSYPVNRKNVIISKLIVIITLILSATVASEVFQNILFLCLNQAIPMIGYSITLPEILLFVLTTFTSILLGMVPLYVGMLNKSTVVTVVSSIAIVSLTVSSGGANGGGLITMIPISITFAVIGVALVYMSIKKMLVEDIII